MTPELEAFRSESLARLKSALKQSEIAIDAELAQTFLQGDMESRPALVSALEQVRMPLRAKLIQDISTSWDTNWVSIEEWKRKYSESNDQMIAHLDECIEAERQNIAEMFVGLDTIEAIQDLEESERLRRVQEVFAQADACRTERMAQLDTKQAELLAKTKEVMNLLPQAQKKLEEETATLVETYYKDCHEKSLPIFEEFVV